MPSAAFSFLSLGAGVQSTTLLLLTIDGHLPPIQHAVFADTGWEPKQVYEHLDRLRPLMAEAGIAFHQVSAGNIRHDALDPFHRFASMPLFVQGDPWSCDDCEGRGVVLDPEWRLGDDPDDEMVDCPRCGGAGGGDGKGMIRRQCTSEYKLKPIKEKARELLGAPLRAETSGRVRVGRVPGKPGVLFAENWVGISTDEIGRVRPSDVKYMVRRDPLIELGMTRSDCVRFLSERWPFPVARSACIGCPFHSNAEWREMRDERPDEWLDAIDFDRSIRGGGARAIQRGDVLLGEAFLHVDRVPLDQADIDRLARGERDPAQAALFGDEAFGCSPFACRMD